MMVALTLSMQSWVLVNLCSLKKTSVETGRYALDINQDLDTRLGDNSRLLLVDKQIIKETVLLYNQSYRRMFLAVELNLIMLIMWVYMVQY
jgi:hypothetical protein